MAEKKKKAKATEEEAATVSVAEFENTKASAMGDFLQVKLKMDKDEHPIYMRVQNSYPEGENMVFIFENGKYIGFYHPNLNKVV